LQAKGAPLCIRSTDVDGDAEPEWLGLYHLPADRPRLAAFVLDGDSWYELQAPPQEEHGLGTYATCELEVFDVNLDGRVEILIRGHAEQNVELLHIFVWDGVHYGLLASFQGDAGIQLEDLGGSLSKEVVVRYRVGEGLAWEAVHYWDGASYGWDWERYSWLYAGRPHAYLADEPKHAVISYYLALDDRDLPGAYGLLSGESQSAQAYGAFSGAFHTTLGIEVGAVRKTYQSDASATVTALVRSYDNLDGYVVGKLWDVRWTLVREEGRWWLDSVVGETLDQWEEPYYP
jgi:hypothetical protein